MFYTIIKEMTLSQKNDSIHFYIYIPLLIPIYILVYDSGKINQEIHFIIQVLLALKEFYPLNMYWVTLLCQIIFLF